MKLFLDIETIPSQAPDAVDLVRTTIKPPGTLKKAESIAAWWGTESEAAIQAAYRKQSLDGGTHGEICSIAVADNDDRTWSRCRAPGEPESYLLQEFVNTIEGWARADFHAMDIASRRAWFPADDHYPICHNAAFDLPFLWRRMKVCGVDVPPWLPPPLARVGQNFGCTMLTWAGHGQYVSLDTLCRILGIASPKGGMTGADVFDAWLAGDTERIRRYNEADAMAVRAIWQRLVGGI